MRFWTQARYRHSTIDTASAARRLRSGFGDGWVSSPEGPFEQLLVADLRRHRRKYLGGPPPAQFLHACEQARIRSQRGEILEQQRALAVHAEDLGREILQRTVLFNQSRRADPAD